MGDIKSVYILSLKFGFRSGKSDHTDTNYHVTGGPSDLSEGVYKHKLLSKKDLHRKSLPPHRYFAIFNWC